MAFATHVLHVFIVLGTNENFKTQALSQYRSKVAGVLKFETVLTKLCLYFINAKAPWLHVIAFRRYKLVGVAIAMDMVLMWLRSYLDVTFYVTSAM